MRKLDEIIRDVDQASSKNPGQHWVFDYFSPFSGEVPVGTRSDYIGSFTSEVQGQAPSSSTWMQNHKTVFPSHDDEYFEWTDLLECVLDADRQFVFVELGAGFGRWTVRAALAARLRGIGNVKLVIVEGEPLHAQWARLHMALNNVGEHQYQLFESAVSAAEGQALFVVKQPNSQPVSATTEEALSWYGQCLASSAGLGNPTPADGLYHGRRMWNIDAGYAAIEIPVMPLAIVLDGLPRVDLIDMDIQGEEGPLISECVDLLSSKVRRLHIETHSTAVEDQIRDVLMGADWKCLRDYSLQKKHETPFGEIFFQGGLQSWINPRLFGSD